MRRIPKLIQFFEYLFIRLIFSLVQIMPGRLAILFGKGVGMLFYFFSSHLRQLTGENLAIAFPEKNKAGIRSLSRKTFRHFGANYIETVKILHYSPQRLRSLIENDQQTEKFNSQMRRSPHGAVIISAHFGNIVLMGARMGIEGHKLNVVYGTTDNRFLDDYLIRLMKKAGINLLTRKKNGFYTNISAEIIRRLLDGEMMTFFIDINWFVSKSVLVDFFGKSALTPRGPAHILFDNPFPGYVIYIDRLDWRRHRIHIEEFPIDRSIHDKEEFIRHHMQKFTQFFEELIRRRPEQWFWFHPRWRIDYPSKYRRRFQRPKS